MGLFSRGPRKGAADEVETEVEARDGAPAGRGTPGGGPWDADEPHPQGPRVDLGAIRLPAVQGMELRMEVDKATEVVSAAALTLKAPGEGGVASSLQVQAFAAPRTDGIWDEIREEIAASITQQGGTVDDLPGPFGRELLARLPVRTPEGRTGHRPARFIGTDGPRWFLRGVITGAAAVDPQAAVPLERVFGTIVVVRGQDPRAPRDLLALHLPGGASPSAPAAAPATPRFAPPQRGPEITETR
ncbi:DUF3710 domain-containing protein [Cellulomonas sp. SLBN-39]|uniref:DUF3710 domain-containing protein n=1 Tax=Cellulomonas sp. SLBN-39 TaxID=2768446 RepID=UPI00114E24CE|nr:DUF3710 domain-containing protein [Cellulomonas sp. SLBN-39]TQL04340.1 uncharacterized protein DUF3710 [Cellulomonas sp. SLBN-39]